MSEDTVSNICSPALIYLCFSLIQIVIDVYKQQFQTAFFKFWVMLIITTLLNILCERGLSIVSWLIVFVPIISMSIVMIILLFFLGFKPGQANKTFNIKTQSRNDLRNQMVLNQNNIALQTQNMDKINMADSLEKTEGILRSEEPEPTGKSDLAKTPDLSPEAFFTY
tara:strand:- start:201 stop:701 length:501 start_codon:yes stop_codon:yes gene_type:complete